MRRFSANLVFTNTGAPIKNGVVGVNEVGEVVEIIDHRHGVKEYRSTEFHNGIIVPGFINAHCHTELSHLKGEIEEKTGLAGFVSQIRDHRLGGGTGDYDSIQSALQEMERQGVVAVGDICNTADSLEAKGRSRIKFLNFIEVLGLNPDAAESTMQEAGRLATEFKEKLNIPSWITPHSVYSLSTPLWQHLSSYFNNDSIISIHYAESGDEEKFVSQREGGIADNYSRWGLPMEHAPADTPFNILETYLPEKAKILFIHNTYLKQKELEQIGNTFPNSTFVLCPTSNLYIENRLPDIAMLSRSRVKIALGTDSLASSATLSVFRQIQVILKHFPELSFEQVMMWATQNGAQALGMESTLGTIEVGKSPGLNLITPFDFVQMRPYDHSRVVPLV